MTRNTTRRSRWTPALLAALALGTMTTAAQAGDRFRSRADADIDELEAKIVYGARGAQLWIHYEIEIEDATPFDRFELAIRLTQHGRPVAWGPDAGSDVLFTPLVRPNKIDDDELEFYDVIQVPINPHLFAGRGELEVHATIIDARTGRPLDRDDTEVDNQRRGFRRGLVYRSSHRSWRAGFLRR